MLLWGFTSGDLKCIIPKLRLSVPNLFLIGKGRTADLPVVMFHEFDIDRIQALYPLPVASSRVRLSASEVTNCYSVMQREHYAGDMEHADLRDMLNFFEAYFSELLLSREVKQVVFSMVPHLGPELILFYVARRLGLRTKMFYQSLFNDRFFAIEEPAELGRLPSDGAGLWPMWQEEFRFGVPEQTLFYMLKLPVPESHSRWLKRLVLVRLRKWLLGRARDTGLLPIAAASLRRHRFTSYMASPPWSDESTFCNQPYVYFPLHLQPELTTDPLGGCYGDQALAIERLRSWLPSDVAIVVKENPKQHYEWRDPAFYERIRTLPSVFLVDRKVNTYKLLRNSTMVATITGTAGWESLLMGRPVIVFGAAWYAGLPGVFSFSSELNYADLLAFTADFGELKRALDGLSTYMPLGVVDMHYLPICPDYNQGINESRLLDVLNG